MVGLHGVMCPKAGLWFHLCVKQSGVVIHAEWSGLSA
jgi:hypothetical protein